MTAASDFLLHWSGGGGDPLETRLRALRWMEAPREVRERCWRQLDWRIEEQQAAFQSPEQTPSREPGRCDRYSFRRGTPPRPRTLAERWPLPTDGGV